jgi:hypothetical protein
LLLGVVGAEGSVDFFKERIDVTPSFVDIASRGRAPEGRFRFAAPCAQKACPQWREKGCGVADAAARATAELALPDQGLPACSIRPSCRWFSEHGASICKACRYVVTERPRPSV